MREAIDAVRVAAAARCVDGARRVAREERRDANTGHADSCLETSDVFML